MIRTATALIFGLIVKSAARYTMAPKGKVKKSGKARKWKSRADMNNAAITAFTSPETFSLNCAYLRTIIHEKYKMSVSEQNVRSDAAQRE